MIFEKKPDPGWIPLLEVLLEGMYKITLVIGMVILTLCIALGTVRPETSYGLKECLEVLGLLAGAAQLAGVFKSKNEQTVPPRAASNPE